MKTFVVSKGIHSAVSLSVTLAAGLAFAGCVAGPKYQKPEAAATVAPAYNGATNEWKVAQPQAHLPKGNWWELFGDAELNRFEAQALMANQELKAAFARFEQARALVNVARANLYPHVDFSPSATRNRDSAHRPLNGVNSNHADNYNNFMVPIDLGYEFDLWGRVRHTVESATAQQQANADDLESVKLAIQAEIATDYFTLRALDSEHALLVQSVDSLTKALELTQNRKKGGIATDLDVSQAETVLKTTQAQLPLVDLQRVKLEHALAVLTGQAAPGFGLAAHPLDLTPPNIPPGLPSELLERRPDIAGAERRMATANANVGIAQTAFYPTVKFNGLAGFQSVSVGTLFNWPSRLWSVGPSLTVPLFDAGRNRANLQAAKSAYDETVANYRQTVLVAFSEVEDNLAAQHLLATESEAELAALRAAKRTLEIASNRYHSGLVTYLDVSTAQTTAIDREREVVRLRGEQLVAAVSLVKSLGGGWENSSTAARPTATAAKTQVR